MGRGVRERRRRRSRNGDRVRPRHRVGRRSAHHQRAYLAARGARACPRGPARGHRGALRPVCLSPDVAGLVCALALRAGRQRRRSAPPAGSACPCRAPPPPLPPPPPASPPPTARPSPTRTAATGPKRNSTLLTPTPRG